MRPDGPDFTDVLDAPEDILEEPRFLSYTARFWESPDGELYFRPWREFLLVPGQHGLFRLAEPEDTRRVFNILKLRNILAVMLLFVLIAATFVMVAAEAIPLIRIWPDAVVVLASLVTAFAIGMVPVNLWCLLVFLRQTRQPRRETGSGLGS